MDSVSRERLRQRLTRIPPVRWLHPVQLFRTGLRVLAARILGGAFSTRRETEAVLPAELYDFASTPGELWIDYVADVGDGFDATYAIARSIAHDRLPEDAPVHGDLLVLGGDATYPVASDANYERRTTSVYDAALPDRDPNAPPVLAIPGNHDWYDGLNAFRRTFCEGWLTDAPNADASPHARWADPRRRNSVYAGGWRTVQSRSYFAARLTDGWWLWGIDVQWGGPIDTAQLAYFADVAGRISQRDNIICCVAEPEWVDTESTDPATLLSFCERVLGPRSNAIRLVLAGDHHHYARYEPTNGDGPVLVTCGGGGAYLSPTHQLPDSVSFGRWGLGDQAEFRRTRTFPDPAESRPLANGFWKLPWRNPGLVALLGVLYALLGWLLAATQSDGMLAAITDYSLGDTTATPGSIPAFLAVLGTLAAGVAIAGPTRWASGRTLIGLAHGAAHLSLCLLVLYAMRAVPLPDAALIGSVLATLCIGAVCGILGAHLFATYLYLGQYANGLHSNELFVGLRIEDYKSYLRLRIGRDGVTVYPIGVRTVPRQWAAADSGPLLEPRDGSAAEPIEPPFTIKPRS